MARTLYSYVRVLPAYRLYRACRDHRGAAYNLTYRLLRKPAPVLQPADVGGRQDGGPKCCHVERFAFAPIETMTGSLRISVQYQPQVAPLASVTAVPASIPQHIITDYIRAPGVPLPSVCATLQYIVRLCCHENHCRLGRVSHEASSTTGMRTQIVVVWCRPCRAAEGRHHT